MKTADSGSPSGWRSKRGPATGLEGLEGRVQLRIAGNDAGVLVVRKGTAEIVSGDGATAILDADTESTLVSLLGGELPPVVAALQGRAHAEGDRAQAIRILFGLQADSPWRGLVRRS